MNRKLLLNNLIFGICILISNQLFACTGGTLAGTLNPTTSYQTTPLQNGNYFTVNVTMCDQVEFTFCSADFAGINAPWDTQITLLDATGATQLAFNDDNCSLQSKVIWTASFTGTIRVLISKYSCNNDLTLSATMGYKKIPATGNYCLFSNASNVVISGQNCIQLTPASNTQTGCAWNKTPIDFNQSFNLTLDYYFGANINGADGTTFTFLPTPTGCGTGGAQMGTGGLSNALVIEFDTYDNDNPAHVFDIAADHIAVSTNGNLLSPPLCGPVQALPSGLNIDDGAVHQVKISWNAATQTLSIYLDNNLRLTCNNNFVANVFGGQSQIYWGATGATGGLNNQQYFCPSTVVLPVKLTSFTTQCNGEFNNIEWKTETENRVSHYLVEYTFDGYTYYTLANIPAHGNSETPLNYNYIDQNQWKQQVYYRLTAVDLDGNRESSDLISGFLCNKHGNELLAGSHVNEKQLQLQFTEKHVNYQLIDLTGKPITEVLSNDDEASINLPLHCSAGVYLLNVWKTSINKKETHRIVIAN